MEDVWMTCDNMISFYFPSKSGGNGDRPFSMGYPTKPDQIWIRLSGGGTSSPTTFRRVDGEATLLSCRSSHAWDRTRLCPAYQSRFFFFFFF